MADVILDVVEVEAGFAACHLGQHDEGLHHHQTDLVGHAKEVRLSANGHTGGDVSHQFFWHVIGRKRVEDGAVLGEDRGDQHKVVESASIFGQLRNLGEKIDIALGIDGHHGIAFTDILFDDVLHDAGLAHASGAEAPEMAFAVAVREA